MRRAGGPRTFYVINLTGRVCSLEVFSRRIITIVVVVVVVVVVRKSATASKGCAEETFAFPRKPDDRSRHVVRPVYLPVVL